MKKKTPQQNLKNVLLINLYLFTHYISLNLPIFLNKICEYLTVFFFFLEE